MNHNPFFSIIVVCLNPGSKLMKTLESIAMQTFRDYEVIIKDGQSTDSILEAWEKENTDRRIRLYREKDGGIYDAMNQAAAKVSGRYVYFLNCGDLFRNEKVLEAVRENIRKKGESYRIFYGDIFEILTGQQVASNPQLDLFACYRNLPCHQACFYQIELLRKHPFETKYKVRADYEQFLWCLLEEKVLTVYLPVTIACYEGGGFSETKENRRLSAREHKEIVERYMEKGELFLFRFLLLITFAPLRTKLAENKKTAAIYNGLKRIFYHKTENN